MKQRTQLGKSNVGRDINRIVVAVNSAPTIVTGADHGTLTGLDGDDHSQYFNLSQDELVNGQPTFNPGTPKPPWILHANAQDQLVVGLRADSLNKSVLAGSGLITGGALTADVTLDIGAGDGINVLTNSIEVDVTDLIGAGLVEIATNNIGLNDTVAGAGLVIDGSKIIDVGAGDGINVLSNSIEVDVTDLIGAGLVEIATNNIGLADSVAGAGLTIDGSKIISINPGTGLEIDTDAIIHSTGDLGDLHTNYPEIDQVETITGGWKWSIDLIPNLTDTYDIGSSTKLWKTGWLSELQSILFVTNAVRVEGGWLVIAHDAGTLAADINASQTTIDFGKAMTTGDFVVFRGNLQVEYISIDSLSSGTTYNVTRNLDASGGNSWTQGTVYLVLGQTGDGRIELTADNSDSPKISFMSQGATYNAQLEYARIGNLRSSYGIGASDTFGVGLGRFETGYNYLSLTAASGLEFYDTADAVIAQLTGTDWTLGKAATENVHITSAAVQIRNGSTVMAELTADDLILGDDATGDYVSIDADGIEMFSNSIKTIDIDSIGNMALGQVASNQGNAFWNNSNKRFEFRGGTAGTVVAAYIDTDGTITAGGGDVTINADGIQIEIDDGYFEKSTIQWMDGADERVHLYGEESISQIKANLKADGHINQDKDASIALSSHAGDTSIAYASLGAIAGSGGGSLSITIDGSNNYASLSMFEMVGFQIGNSLVPDAMLHVIDTTSPQFRLEYSGSFYADFSISSAGDLTIDAVGNNIHLNDYVNVANGLRVGDSTAPSNDDIRATADIVAGGGLYAGNVSGEPGTGYIKATNDINAGGGIRSGSTTGAVNTGDVILSGELFINETVNGDVTTGMTVHQGSASNSALAIKGTGVAHAMTTQQETDTFFFIKQWSGGAGGSKLVGLSDGSQARGMSLHGAVVTGNTTHTSGAVGVVTIEAHLKSGSTWGVVGTNVNLCTWRNNGSSRMTLTGNGRLFLDSTSTIDKWDDYDDMALLEGLRGLTTKQILNERTAEWVKEARPILEDTGIMEFGKDSRNFVNTLGLQMLTIDAMRQLYAKMERYEKALLGLGISPKMLESGLHN